MSCAKFTLNEGLRSTVQAAPGLRCQIYFQNMDTELEKKIFLPHFVDFALGIARGGKKVKTVRKRDVEAEPTVDTETR